MVVGQDPPLAKLIDMSKYKEALHLLRAKKGLFVCLALAILLTTIGPIFVEASTNYGGAVAKSAADLVGRAYQLGGASPSGFDASGLVMYVYGLQGAQVPRTVSDQFSVGSGVSKRADLRAGDIVLFQSGSTKWTGIYLGANEVVWASSGTGKVIKKNITHSSVSGMLTGARRLPNSAFSGGTNAPTPAPTTKATQVITTAQSFLGVPYVFGATGPRSFDCSGFTRYVFAQHGISLPRTSVSQASAGVKVASRSQMVKGDLLIFVDTYKAGISHVGIYMGDGRFIHTIPNGGVGYANLSNSYWSSRLHSARRVIR